MFSFLSSNFCHSISIIQFLPFILCRLHFKCLTSLKLIRHTFSMIHFHAAGRKQASHAFSRAVSRSFSIGISYANSHVFHVLFPVSFHTSSGFMPLQNLCFFRVYASSGFTPLQDLCFFRAVFYVLIKRCFTYSDKHK